MIGHQRATTAMCCYCLQLLHSRLNKLADPDWPSSFGPDSVASVLPAAGGKKGPVTAAQAAVARGLYVVWRKQDEQGQSTVLLKTRMRDAERWMSVRDKLVSAVKLFRKFLQANRQHAAELDAVYCDVVMLERCEPLTGSLLDWQLHDEGLYMKSADANYLMLPQRPAERQLSKDAAVRHCARKAGIDIPADADLQSIAPSSLRPAACYKIRTSCATLCYTDATRSYAPGPSAAPRFQRYLNWRTLLKVAVVVLAFCFIRWGEVEYDVEYDSFLANYELLGLEQTATLPEVKKAFRKLSLTMHPDKVPNCDAACQEAWLKINKAHQQIVDYDRGVLKLKQKDSKQR